MRPRRPLRPVHPGHTGLRLLGLLPTLAATGLLVTAVGAAILPSADPSAGAATTTTTTTTPTPTTTTTTIAGTQGTATTTPDQRRPQREADLNPQHYIDDYHQSPDRSAGVLPNVLAPSARTSAEGQTGVHLPPEPGPLDDNVFVDVGDSRWISTTTDAESTFGLDVDTGSYRVGRAQLDVGACPDPASIRVEEWVNAFRYGDVAPSATAALGVTVDGGRVGAAQSPTSLVRIGIAARSLVDDERPQANITFVIDTSGSMDIRQRLGLVKASLALLVQHLNDGDTLSIVEYGDEARTLLAPTPVQDSRRIIDVIDNLSSRGSTNMEAGLMLGYQQARQAFRAGQLNVVVLASDGVANVGSTDAGVLTETITRAGEVGINLVTVGFGLGNYNDVLMEQLANRGDGFYSYVDTLEEARRLFVAELTPTLTMVAKDAKAQVRFDPAVVDQYRLVGYQNRGLDDSQFDDETVDAGELGAGHQVSALYEVRLTAAAADRPAAVLGELALRWRNPSGEAAELRQPLSLDRSATSDSLRLAATVAGVAELLRAVQPAEIDHSKIDHSKIDHSKIDHSAALEALLATAIELRNSNVNGADELVSLISASRGCTPIAAGQQWEQ